MDITKCPAHPETSGESKYGGLWCWGEDRTCKWAVKEFVNDTEDGGVEKVTKYHLPEPGRWLTKEDYISAVSDGAFPHGESLTDAARAASEATIDKDRLIVRQVCVKAACEALAISPLNAEEKAGRITYLAGELEDWIFRS